MEFDGDALRKLAAQFLALAEKRGATILLVVGHRLMGSSLLQTGDIAQGRAQYDQAIAFYDPIEHRRLATWFGHDNRVAALAFRPLAHWLLGYPEAANADIQQSLTYAREIGQAATLIVALSCTSLTHVSSGNYEATNRQTEEAIALADEKAAPFWKAIGTMNRGWLCAQNGKFADAVQMLTSGIVACRSTGARMWLPLYLSYLAKAHAELGPIRRRLVPRR
jgi:predicted ATPase